MARPFDVSKFRKSITKNIEGISVGFRDPKIWISTNNYALNYLISGDFNKGFPIGKVSILAGESGSGKSLISTNAIKNAQDQGIYVILIDTENALDKQWLEAFDVDTSEDKLLKLNMAMVDDVARTISDFVKEYKTLPEADRPKVLFVIDSLGMLLTPTDVTQFEAGDMKGDMGRKPKALASLVRNTVNMFGDLDIGMLCTNHTYQSQDIFNPDDKISGGNGPIFAASIVVAMRKGKLKEDETGEKTSSVHGIRSMCKIMKTRYSKPFEATEIKIPYNSGIDPYSGLVDMFESRGLLAKDGNKLKFIDPTTGEEIKYFRKEWMQNTNGCLDKVMAVVADLPGGLFKTVEAEETAESAETIVADVKVSE